jgi:helix-turn-helix protein
MSEPEYMTVAEARDFLGVSRKKIADLIDKGVLASEPNPLDNRSKLVLREAVEALKAKVPHYSAKKEAA